MSHGEIAKTLGISATASRLRLVAGTGKAAAPARGGRTMMKDRWRSTRARLNQETGSTDTSGLWSRIDASRRAGNSVDLPAADPRRPVSPVLVALLLLAALAGGDLIRRPTDAVIATPMSLPAAPEDDPAFDWFATPALAQSLGAASTLARIDPIDPSRLANRLLVYRYASGYDDVVTEDHGVDTIDVARDTVAGQARIVVSYGSWIRRSSVPVTLSYSGVDTIALTSAGRFIFMNSAYARNDRPDQVSYRNISISRDSAETGVQCTPGQDRILEVSG